jgi:hypothetical protein
VRPVTTYDVNVEPVLALTVVHVELSVDWRILYPVIVAPPLDVGAIHVKVAWSAPAWAASWVGWLGVVIGVAVANTAEPTGGVPLVTLKTGVTWKVYCVPSVRPVKVADKDVTDIGEPKPLPLE